MSEAQMEVEVSKAALSTELAVRFEAFGEAYQALADAGKVTVREGEQAIEHGPARGLMRVLVVEEDMGRERALVQVPGEVIMGGRRVWVPSSTLRR